VITDVRLKGHAAAACLAWILPVLLGFHQRMYGVHTTDAHGDLGIALFAMLVSPGMNFILSVSAKAWSIYVRTILGSLDNMLVQ